jgi:drug/metabolite transporter (DMT)-like permease
VYGLAGSPHLHRSFFAISGLYFSLQNLSLSDAIALTFISPILTGFSGALFLKETLSLKNTFAGCMYSYAICGVIAIHGMLVCSFFGVILIARPPFLFGSPKGSQSEVVTPEQRMLSTLSEGPCLIFRCSFLCYCAVLL